MAVQQAPTRYRASLGRYLEDFVVGDVYEHFPGRTITETDNIQFSLLTMNYHPMHCDAAFAAKSEFGKPLVNSGLTRATHAPDEPHTTRADGGTRPRAPRQSRLRSHPGCRARAAEISDPRCRRYRARVDALRLRISIVVRGRRSVPGLWRHAGNRLAR